MRNVKILVAPLDWGLGHASRCVPIIKELLRRGCEVCIAANGAGSALLKKEFPGVKYFELKGYGIFYHTVKYMLRWKMVQQIPRISFAIKRESTWLEELLKKERFDVVISDNRYGLYHKDVYSVFITHQLHIKSGMGKWVDGLIQRINYRYIARFNECWVPDYGGTKNLSGSLSHSSYIPTNTHYIGPLSRFTKMDAAPKYELLIMLSGPEPSRTAWEEDLFKQLTACKGSAMLVRGLPGVCECEAPPGSASLAIINHLSASDLNLAIAQSEWVICRSGYSSVMDLIKMGKKAILIPTPGQPEQEYLAEYLKAEGLFYSVPQSRFSLQQSIAEAKLFASNASIGGHEEEKFTERLDALITLAQAKKSQQLHGTL